MRFSLPLLAAVLLSIGNSQSASISPAQLLPKETLGFVSIPDCDKGADYWKNSPSGQLWQDPALKAFRENWINRWKAEVTEPLERHLGIRLSDYGDLLRGQMTVGVTYSGGAPEKPASTGLLFILDTKDKHELLKSRLTELKKRWTEAGRQLKTERIREIDCTTVFFTGDELGKTLEKFLPAPKEDSDTDDATQNSKSSRSIRTGITFGQIGSLFIAGNNPKDIERVVANQTGAQIPSLAEQAAFDAQHAALFRDSLGFVWINFATIFENMQKRFSASGQPDSNNNPFAPRPDKILSAIGLDGVSSLTGRLTGSREGTLGELFVQVPESHRKGLFAILATEKKEAGPLPFIRSDVLEFSRWRVDGQKAWNTIESTLTAISPEIAGLLQLGLQSAGKDRDPNFDFKKALVGNLGDDFISVQKSLSGKSNGDSAAAGSLYLIGSPNPDQLIQALRAATGLMPLAGNEPKISEREFLGKRIYSLALSPGPATGKGGGAGAQRNLSFTSAGGYAAISTDESAIEDYLRSIENSGKSLRETTGLTDASQKVGGTSTGHFAYSNWAESLKTQLDSIQGDGTTLNKILALAPLAGGKSLSNDNKEDVKSWVDPSLLPPFSKIAKYFYFLVYSSGSSPEGLSWRAFSPTPPQLRSTAP